MKLYIHDRQSKLILKITQTSRIPLKDETVIFMNDLTKTEYTVIVTNIITLYINNNEEFHIFCEIII